MTSLAATGYRPVLDQPTEQLLREIEDDPLVPRHICVIAPGGYGKSLILRELSELYRRLGVDAVVVDDAHRLAGSELARLAPTESLRLAVAYRPWPRPAGLAELLKPSGRARSVLAPGPFDVEQVAAYLEQRLGRPPARALVEFVHEQTGGVPRFVQRLSAAVTSSDTTWAARASSDATWASRVPHDATRDAHVRQDVPRVALLRFRSDLEQLDEDVQRFLLAVDAGAGLHTELLAALFGRGAEAIGELRAAARASGLLGDDSVLPPIVRRAIASLMPVERRADVRQRLAELQLERGGPVLVLARSLLATGTAGAHGAAGAAGAHSVVGDRMAAVFRAGASEAKAEAPELAARLYAAAVAAGGPARQVAADWAEAAARAGDLDTALRLADRVLGADGAPDRTRVAAVAAAALAHRGQLGRAAELYRWAGGASSLAFATVALIGSGHLAPAAELPAPPLVDGPPTLLDGAASLLAHGVRQSVTGSAAEALPTLVRAATMLEPTGRTALLPDSPAALAAVFALHCGELRIAESVLARAVAAGMGGPVLSARHRLLQAWTCMVRGDTAAAASLLAGLPRLESRDRLFAVALEAGLARRASDLPALHLAWEHAREAVMRHPVDLFTLLPLGELEVAAARLREHDRLAPHLAAARTLLAALGDPPQWVAPLRWSGLHAAIVGEQPERAAQHAAALAELAGHGQYCAALADAAQCWLAVVAGDADPSTVESAARGLHTAGLSWDAARLAGQAAIRTSDRKAMVQLLDCARQLQGRPARPQQQLPSGQEPAQTGTLSDREREVADLVLAGLTYKQIGDRLFISAKTVEHHMARMRHKLGCASRSELLAQLRALPS